MPALLAWVSTHQPGRTLLGVISQMRAIRIQLFFSASQVPTLPTVLREDGETFQEAGVAPGKRPKNLCQDIASAPCSVPLTIKLIPYSFQNLGGGGGLIRFLRIGRGEQLVTGRGCLRRKAAIAPGDIALGGRCTRYSVGANPLWCSCI